MTRIEQKTKKNRLIKFNKGRAGEEPFPVQMLGNPPEQFYLSQPAYRETLLAGIHQPAMTAVACRKRKPDLLRRGKAPFHGNRVQHQGKQYKDEFVPRCISEDMPVIPNRYRALFLKSTWAYRRFWHKEKWCLKDGSSRMQANRFETAACRTATGRELK